MSDYNYYKVGGSLEYQHPTYVVRQADYDLYEGLMNGDFCYVLNSRQMGKSSLRVQMMKKLKEQGVKCASIDMTRIGSHVTSQEWYAGVVSELLRGFGLSRKVDFSGWWRDREVLPPLQRLSELIEDVLLLEFSQKLVIFIDEIDSIIKIKFKEDFFAFIRACYNQRVDNPEYNRLTFCLLGVATPSDLIADKNTSTPFNIGRAIELTGFQLHEATPLVQGLEGKTCNPQVVLGEVLAWTGGQPFLTQKVCKLIQTAEEPIPAGGEAGWVEFLVQKRLIENWETQDEPEHLRTIRDRILWSDRKSQLLLLYQQILPPPQPPLTKGGKDQMIPPRTSGGQEQMTPPLDQGGQEQMTPPLDQGGQGGVKAKDTPEQMELRLSGLVVKEQSKLRVYNRIYESVFNQSWVENALAEAGLLPELAETKAPLEPEIQALEQAAVKALRLFEVRQIKALLSAMQAGVALKALVKDSCPLQDYPTLSPLLALQTILDNIRERNQFKTLQDMVYDVCFSPDGQRIATAGSDGTVRLWNLFGQQLAEWKGHQGIIYAVSFSPDGQRLITAGRDGTAKLWLGQQMLQFNARQVSVLSVSFSPDGQLIATAGGDGKARLWNLSGQQIAQLDGHQRSVWSVSFSPDGQLIATAGGDHTARLWNLSGQQIAQFDGHQRSVLSVSFRPDGQYIATAGRDGTARLWNLSGQQLAQFDGHRDWVRSVSFSRDGQYIATAGYDGTARLWDLSGQQLAQLNGHIAAILGMSFSPDGQCLATAGSDGTTRLWDLSEKHLAQWNSHRGGVWSVSFSPDGQRLATAGADSSIRLWNLQGKLLAQLDGHQGWVRRVSFSPDGQSLATAGYDGTARLWKQEGQQIVLNGRQGRVNSLSFSPDGLRLATAGDDGTVRFWNMEGKQLGQLNAHQGKVYGVSFSPDGQRLATAGADGTARLWQMSGQQLSEFKCHRGRVYSLSFSPDGQRLATVGDDGTVRLWDLSGHELAQWQSHQGTVYCISFNPNGQQIATAGADRMAKLWDLSGRQLAQWQSPNNSVYSVVSFSPDGKCLATVGTGGIQIWRIGGLDELLTRGCDWLKDYFVTHPEELEKLEVCQNRFKSVQAGKNQARVGDVEGAIAPQTTPALPPADASAPKPEVRQLAAKALVAVLGEMLARHGQIEKAVAAYAEAQRLDPTIEIPAVVGNNLCWWGSLWGRAADVMDACETAVALAPENAKFRDSRGLARALTGNIAGAIEDFQAFVDWTDNQEKRLQRQGWIDALRAGENPFTEEEIENLFHEYVVAHPELLQELEECQNRLGTTEGGRNLTGVDDVEGATLTSPDSAPVVPDNLSSERGIDYTRRCEDYDYYKIGGSLEYQHPSYVVRQADSDLYEGLKNGEFCYVLNSRQMGKSSLRVQTMRSLQAENIACAAIDITAIGSSDITSEQWYAGVIDSIVSSLNLYETFDLNAWWTSWGQISSVQRLNKFVEEVLLKSIPQKIVIFIDEIDSVLSLKFPIGDFFAFIRACYNKRADNPEYERLSFALLGVATPADLIADKNRTPFNIGRAIELTGFQLHEATPLAQGLAGKTSNPQAVLGEVLAWTGGQPFLTQKVCKLIQSSEETIPAGSEAAWVENLVRKQIIENWETQDEPEHLRTIRDRLLRSQRQSQLLKLYQQMIPPLDKGGQGGVKANDTPEQMELRLSGLVVKQQGKLRVYNRIYASVFNQSWVENVLAIEADRNPATAGDVEGATLSSPDSAPVIPDNLSSECGIDYTRLRDLLAAGEWQQADLETTAIMLRISGREAEGWLREEDIENFPCTDLLIIDRLWVEYSQGRFGLSVQKEIWQSVGGTKNADYEIYCIFCKRLGWGDRIGRREFGWWHSRELTFNTTAPIGHLPGGLLDWLWSNYRESLLSLMDEITDSTAFHGWWNIISSMASKLAQCNTQSPASRRLAKQRLVTTASKESEEGFLGEFLVHDKLLRIYQGDITNLVTDVIVSSDDNYLTMGGGVSARIRQVGGEEIYNEARKLTPVSFGEVAVTTAGKLRAQKIFHGVVRDFYQGKRPSDEVIEQIVHECMKRASMYNFESIAFPLLGTGAFCFPLKVCWEITLRQTIRDLSEENQSISEVIIVLYAPRTIAERLNIKNYLLQIKKRGWKTFL